MKLGLFFPATPWAGHPRGGAADFGRSSGVSRRSWDENMGGWCLLVYVARSLVSCFFLKNLRLCKVQTVDDFRSSKSLSQWFSSSGGLTIMMPMLLVLLVPPFSMVDGRGPYPSAKVNVWRSSNVWRTRWHRQLGHQCTTKRCTESFGNVPSKIGDLIWWVCLGKELLCCSFFLPSNSD